MVVFPYNNIKGSWHLALKHHGSGVPQIQWEAARQNSQSKTGAALPAPVTRGLRE